MAGPVEADPEYQLIVQVNLMAAEFDAEIGEPALCLVSQTPCQHVCHGCVNMCDMSVSTCSSCLCQPVCHSWQPVCGCVFIDISTNLFGKSFGIWHFLIPLDLEVIYVLMLSTVKNNVF